VIYIESYCSQCGTKLRPQAKFCEGCGKKVQTSDESKEQLIKEIEQEIKTKTRKEVLAEIQGEKARCIQVEKGRKSRITNKEREWMYIAILSVIIFYIIFLILVFTS